MPSTPDFPAQVDKFALTEAFAQLGIDLTGIGVHRVIVRPDVVKVRTWARDEDGQPYLDNRGRLVTETRTIRLVGPSRRPDGEASPPATE